MKVARFDDRKQITKVYLIFYFKASYSPTYTAEILHDLLKILTNDS